jgi:outer membrane protein TolC
MSAFRFPQCAVACASAAFLLVANSAFAALSYEEATQLAVSQAPSLRAQHFALESAQAAQPAAAELPDPKLAVGVENLPVAGSDRLSLTRDFMTMQRIGVMQEVPNAAKRAARADWALAKVQRERVVLDVAQLGVQREAALAWLAVYFAEQRVGIVDDLARENVLLLNTLDARITSGKAMPAERTMARQEALGIADMRDDATRDVAKARATLRRWVGPRGDETLQGLPPALHIHNSELREQLHRHAELAPYAAMQAMARAEADEAQASARGDWAWEVAYSRRGPQYADMISFQLSFDLPLWGERRQQPLIAAKRLEVERISAEREAMLREHGAEVEAQLAEVNALDAQANRLAGDGLALAQERITLALGAYEGGRGDLAAVLAARREAVQTRLRVVDLDAQRMTMRVRLTTQIAD